MNYYEHHLGDYVRDAAHLSLVEEGAYRRLLDAYYIREAPLPVAAVECCKLARATSKAEREAVALVLREFFTLEADGHHQRRADGEIAAFRKRIDHNRTVGKLGGRPRKPKPGDNPGVPVEKPGTNPLQTPGSILSEAIASGGEAAGKAKTRGQESPPQPVDLIFGLGLPLLMAASVPEKNGRSMLGLMRKQHGDARVVEALQRMAEERPLEPVAWLQARLRAAPPQSRPAQKSFAERDSDRNAASLHKLTGGLLGRPLSPVGDILDMEPPDGRVGSN